MLQFTIKPQSELSQVVKSGLRGEGLLTMADPRPNHFPLNPPSKNVQNVQKSYNIECNVAQGLSILPVYSLSWIRLASDATPSLLVYS